jgi:uncharacterized protein YukJ
MPLKRYAVLKGRPVAMLMAAAGNPHFHIKLEAGGRFYRVAINVRSMMNPSEMEYLIKLRFGHPITGRLCELSPGLHPVERCAGGLALDYQRLNLFHNDQFLKIPDSTSTGQPGPQEASPQAAVRLPAETDFADVLKGIFTGAVNDPGAWVYVYGEPWESAAPDRVFGFAPSRGMHDIHMNQGNDPCHLDQDGPWQDGAVFIEHSAPRRWSALFLKFQSQAWHTDDITGHTLPPRSGNLHAGHPREPHPEPPVRIIAALLCPEVPVAPHAPEPPQTVTLLNLSPRRIDLTGWRLSASERGKWPLHGKLPPGAARVIELGPALRLNPGGGIITLYNAESVKVHGVYYTARQSAHRGWSVAF